MDVHAASRRILRKRAHGSADALARLGRILSSAEIATDVPLALLGRWRIGGPADVVITPQTVGTLGETLRIVTETGAPNIVIGDGSNLLFDDAGFRGVVVRVGRAFGQLRIGTDGFVDAGAGLWMPSFVRRVIDAGLTGAVHAVGIPGTLGGLVTMNGGSQRRGIGENVVHVDVLDRKGNPHRLAQPALEYGYRSSRLQRGDFVVVAARLRFASGDRRAMRREAISILAARRAKFPRVRANCGSVFVSDPKLYSLIGPPGEAIERAGLKGIAMGGAQISPEHANFIVNNGSATSAEVLALIRIARRRVFELSGIAMDAEVRHLAPYGTIRAAHLVPAPAHDPASFRKLEW